MVACSWRMYRRTTHVTWWLVGGGCIVGLLTIITSLCLLVSANSRRRRKRRPRTNSMTVTTTTPRTANLSRRHTQAPAPLTLMSDVDPLTSAMLRRHQFEDVTLLQQPAGVRTAEESGNCANYMQNTACYGDNSAQVST